MKKYLFLLLLFPAFLEASAQKLTIHDLLSYYKLDITHIDKRIAKKNFRFIRKTGDDLMDNKSFTYFWGWNFKDDQKDAKEWFTVSTYEAQKSKLVYETCMRDHFVAFIQDLKKSGFNFIEEIRQTDQTYMSTYYGNDKFLVIVQPREDRWTIYFREK